MTNHFKFLFFSLFLLPFAASGQDSLALVWKSMGQAQELAEKQQKKVLVFSEAEWCSYCKKMESKVFPRPDVQDSLYKYFVPVKIDVESDRILKFNGSEMTEHEFALQHRVTATPTFVFLSSDGEIMGVQPGYIPADTFKLLLGFVGSDAHRKMKFKRYMDNHGQRGKQ